MKAAIITKKVTKILDGVYSIQEKLNDLADEVDDSEFSYLIDDLSSAIIRSGSRWF